MKNATDNASDMFNALRRTYNRAHAKRKSRRKSPRSSAVLQHWNKPRILLWPPQSQPERTSVRSSRSFRTRARRRIRIRKSSRDAHNALRLTATAASGQQINVTVEVRQHIGRETGTPQSPVASDRRCRAWNGNDRCTGASISVPVGGSGPRPYSQRARGARR